jgi:uncharacterized protein
MFRRFARALLFAAPLAAAQKPAPAFDTREEMIPMRDGVRLHTLIYTPKSAGGPLPFLFTRTPYGIASSPDRSFAGPAKELFDEGYIFVAQDIRGRHKSEGRFVMLRLPRDRSDPAAIDESTDAYDTIEWLLKAVPGNNGRVGIYGVSYPGWLTLMAMLDPHPALRAASPQASPADMFLGDDFHHHGAFRLSYGFEYAALLETSKDENTRFRFDVADTFEWFVKLGPLANVNGRYFHGELPTWNDFAAHPDYDAFWQRQAFVRYIDALKVPALNVAGWWDQEDFYGPMKIYEALERHDSRHLNYLVVGPWNHGQWAADEGRRLGRIDFGAATGEYFRRRIQAPWFAWWLKDRGRLDLAEATVFETGSSRWERYDHWPPQDGVAEKDLYFLPGARLGFEAPREEGDDACDRFLSDPAHPVPYRQRPIGPIFGGQGWAAWQVEDQRFVYLRPDVAAWATDPLESDLVMPGALAARIYASTTGTDADWVVKLIDVYPEKDAGDPALDGYQLMIAADVLRGRFRNGFEHPQAVLPGEVAEYRIGLLSRNHSFRNGHRIMVQVQSTWFPLIDRNPQKYVANIFRAEAADFQAATHRVWRSRQWPSHLAVTVKR